MQVFLPNFLTTNIFNNIGIGVGGANFGIVGNYGNGNGYCLSNLKTRERLSKTIDCMVYVGIGGQAQG